MRAPDAKFGWNYADAQDLQLLREHDKLVKEATADLKTLAHRRNKYVKRLRSHPHGRQLDAITSMVSWSGVVLLRAFLSHEKLR